MEKFVSFEKLSKKKQREQNQQKRNDWGLIKPITRKIPSQKIYNRKKARNWKQNPDFALLFYWCWIRWASEVSLSQWQSPSVAHPPHPQEQPPNPFLRFLISWYTIAINTPAIIADPIKVGRFIFIHSNIFSSLSYASILTCCFFVCSWEVS